MSLPRRPLRRIDDTKTHSGPLSLLKHGVESLMAVAIAVTLSGCLGGGGGASSSQTSLGSVEFTSLTLVTYDANLATLKLKGSLKVKGVTDLHVVKFFSDSKCSTTALGEGIQQDFTGDGIEIQVPSIDVTDIYVATNTEPDCYFLIQHLPHYDPPPAPHLTLTSPTSPTRASYTPYVVGTVSPATTVIKLFSDMTCTTLLATGNPATYSTVGLQVTLVADSTSKIFGTATDAFGKSSTCAEIGSFTHSSTGPSMPVFGTIAPVSPSGMSITPVLIGTVGLDVTEVAVFSDPACLTQLKRGTANEYRTTGFQLTVTDNAATTLYGQSYDVNGLPSDCAFLTIYVHDAVAPAAPVYTSANPVSPTSTNLYPRIIGTASADAAQIKLYNNGTCTTQIGGGAKSAYEGTGIPAAITSNTTTTIYGTSVDTAGNASACTMLTSYVNDSLPPDPPSFSATLPASPNNQSVTPFVQGNTDVTAVSVRIFINDTCTTQVGAGTVADFTGPGIQVTVPGNATTTLYAVALDEAGNISDCTALTNYAHSTVPAIPPGFFQTIPASPTRMTNKPYVVGTGSTTIASVQLFSDATCTSLLGGATRAVFTTVGIQINLNTNTTSEIYAMSLDVYGNTSPCVHLTSFTNDTIAPKDPVYQAASPTSPNSASYQPMITGTLTPDLIKILPVTTVSLYDSFLCLNRIGTGSPAEYIGAGIQATVPPNMPTDIYARTFDAAGNVSNCTFLTNYIHDALLPGRPILSSITPMTPSYNWRTTITGTVGSTTDFLAPTSIVIYSDAACSNIVTTDVPANFTGAGFPVIVGKNQTTTLYGAIFNVIGTSSPCTALINYVHSDVGPANLSAALNLDGSVGLNWNPDMNAVPTPKYIVRRAIVSGGPYTTIASAVNGSSYTDNTVANLQTYYYVVAATNNTGESKMSAEASIAVNVVVPPSPLGLVATGGPTQVRLVWSGANLNMTFKVLRSNQSGGPYSVVANGLTSATYTDTTTSNNVAYYYVVVGNNPSGDSLQSNEASAVPLDAPPAPMGLTIATISSTPSCGGGSGVVLSWSAPAYFNNFSIIRGGSPGGGAQLATTGNTTYTDCYPAGYGGLSYNYYSVVANWGTLQSFPSNEVVFANEGAPSLTVQPGNGHVLVSWTTVPYTGTFRIERSTQSGGPYTVLNAAYVGTAYNDAAVVNGQAYFYRITGMYGASVPGWPTAEKSAIPGINPAAPTNLVLTVNSSKQPILTWTPPDAYNTFYVYRGPSAGGPWIFQTSTSQTTYTDSSASLGLNYYKVTAIWGTFETASTNLVSFRMGVPASLTATPSATDISLSWSSVTGALNYSLFVSGSSGGPYSLLTTTSSLTYLDTAVVTDTGYFYVVQANFADGTTGQYATEASAMLTTSTIPTGLTVTGTSSSSINVAWAKVNLATTYKLYKSTTIGGTYTLVTTVPTTNGSVTGLLPLTQYFIKVTSVKSGIESPRSNPVSAYTLTIPGAPSANPGSNSIDLSWTSITGVNTFDVLRSTDGVSFASIATGLTSAAHLDTTVIDGNLYFYRIRAYYTNGMTESPSSAGTTPGTVPRVPSGLTVTDNTTGTDLEFGWAPVAGANTYRLYQATASGGPYTLALQTGTTSLNTVSSLTQGMTYYFVLTSVIGSIESSFSAEVAAIPEATPNAPSVQAAGLSIDVTWAAVPGAATYTVLRSTDHVNFSAVTSGLAATSYNDATVSAATNYVYKYRPVTAGSIALADSLVSAAVTPVSQPLSPTSLIGVASGTTSVKLDWITVPNITKYSIYRATASGGPYSLVTTVTAGTTSYTDAGLTPGLTYYFVVTSTNSSNVESGNSNEVGVTLIGAPTGLIATSIANAVNLSWNAVGGATSYSVRRSEVTGGPYGVIATVGTTTYQDTTIKNGITYYYVIAANVGPIVSPISSEASAVGINAMNLQVPIELTDQGMASDTIATTFNRTRTSLDTTAYDGTVTYSYTIVAKNGDSSARAVTLIDSAAATVATINVPANTNVPTRLQAALVPTAGLNNYRVSIAASSASGTVEVLSARMLVNQTNATKTKLYFPLLSSSAGVYTGDDAAFVAATADSSYNSLSAASIYVRNAAALANLSQQNPWELETVVAASGTATGAVALSNVSKGYVVTSTEALYTNATPTLVRSPFAEGAPYFGSADEGDSFQISLRCYDECDTGSAMLYKAGLWVTLATLDKVQTVYRVSLGTNASGIEVLDTERSLINPALFSNPSAYFQTVGSVMFGDTATVDLMNLGATDSGTGGASAVAGSTLIVNSSTKSATRTAAPITLNAGDRFTPRLTPGTGPYQSVDSQIIINSTR